MGYAKTILEEKLMQMFLNVLYTPTRRTDGHNSIDFKVSNRVKPKHMAQFRSVLPSVTNLTMENYIYFTLKEGYKKQLFSFGYLRKNNVRFLSLLFTFEKTFISL